MKKAKDRNMSIRKEVRELINMGYSSFQAEKIVAEKYYLTARTVKDIIYDKRSK